MTEEKLRKVHSTYGIITSALVIFLGICFIVSCVTIYQSGDRPFTRESVSNQLGTILIPILLCLASIIGGVVLSFYPLQNTRLKAKTDYGVTLSRLKERCDFEGCPSELYAKIKKEKGLRITVGVASCIVYAASLAISLIYCFNQSNFPSVDITDEVARAVLVILGCFIVSCAAALASKAICASSISRELEIVKKVLGVSKKATKTEKKVSSCKAFTNVVRAVILTVAIVFIIIGITNGGMADVFEKATRICTECIGLG